MSKSGGGGRGRSRGHGHGGGGGGGSFGSGGGGQKKLATRGKGDYQQRSLRRQMHSAAAAVAATADEDVSDNEQDRDTANASGSNAGGKPDYSEEPNLNEALHAAVFSGFSQYLLDLEERHNFSYNSESSSADTVLARRFRIVRPMNVVLDLLSNPHGSVKLSQGDTCVVVGFYGPSDTRISKELPHRGVVDVIYRPKITGASQLQVQQHDKDVTMQEERTIEAIITNIFETVLYLDEEPAGTGFNLILQEYENDGCLLSACINAANIAILDGCASMRNTVASVTAVVTDSIDITPGHNNHNTRPQPRLLIDPNADQLKKGFSSLFIFAFTNDGQLLYHKIVGRQVTKELYKWVLDQCLKAAQEIFAYYEFIMKKKRGIVLDDDDTPLVQPSDPEMEVISSDEDELLVQEAQAQEVMEVEKTVVSVVPAPAPPPAPVPKITSKRGRGRTRTMPVRTTPVPAKPVPVIDVEDLSSDGAPRELEDGEID